ncbi:MAG: hypothetical protein JSW25_07820 [Thermoplasmata archaeon]|nr:MAG: hypothetical protein JSW25_07820 [Thermoplasmata archaeon]
MPVTPEGYAMDQGSVPRGQTATSQLGEALNRGRPTPVHQEMPYARHMGVHIIVGIDPGAGSDSEAAAANAITKWDAWKEADAREHYTVKDLRFEFITEGKVALYIIYSE